MQNNIYISDYIKQKLYSCGYDFYWIKRYIKFLEWRLSVRVISEDQYYDVHHIIPKTWDKALIKDKNNLIKLTYREHVIAHHLLMKTGDNAMGTALNVMLGKGDYYEGLHTELRAWMLKLNEQVIIAHRKNLEMPVVDLITGMEYRSASYADKVLGLRPGNISLALYNGGLAGGTYWMRKSDMKHDHTFYLNQILAKKKQTKKNASLKIAKAIVNLNESKVYQSTADAARELGVSPDTLSGAARNQIRCKRCYWKYLDEITKPYDQELKEIQELVAARKRRSSDINSIRVYDLTDEKEYKNLAAAGRVFNCNPITIGGHIDHKTPLNNHYFVYSKDLEQDHKQQLKRMKDQYFVKYNGRRPGYAREIINLTTNKIYNQIVDAAKEYNDTTSVIARALKSHKPAFDCYWMYLIEYDSNKTNEQQIEELEALYNNKISKSRNKQAKSISKSIIEVLTNTIYKSITDACNNTHYGYDAIKKCLDKYSHNDHFTADEKCCFVLLDQYNALSEQDKDKLLIKDPKRFDYDIINLTDNIVFRTRTEASKCYNIGEGQITKACNSIATCRKRFWCYRKDLIDNNIQKTLEFKQNQYIEKFGSLLM